MYMVINPFLSVLKHVTQNRLCSQVLAYKMDSQPLDYIQRFVDLMNQGRLQQWETAKCNDQDDTAVKAFVRQSLQYIVIRYYD
jgi:hypothetical protein